MIKGLNTIFGLSSDDKRPLLILLCLFLPQVLQQYYDQEVEPRAEASLRRPPGDADHRSRGARRRRRVHVRGEECCGRGSLQLSAHRARSVSVATSTNVYAACLTLMLVFVTSTFGNIFVDLQNFIALIWISLKSFFFFFFFDN